MRNVSSPFLAASVGYLETLEQSHRANPESIDPGWRCVFDILQDLEIAESERSKSGVQAAIAAAYRDDGHLAARLDPLGAAGALTREEVLPAQIAKLTRSLEHFPADAALIEKLQSIYCGAFAVETAHIDDRNLRAWIHDAVETPGSALLSQARLRALQRLIEAEEFERFMAIKFPAKKRFGLEGAEALAPLLDRLLRRAAAAGVTDVLIGSMHRGRLNITANILAKPLPQIFAEFKGAYPFSEYSSLAADVPYHLGYATELTLEERPLRVTLAPNPSHLEAVKPVVLGRVRARQDVATEPRRVLCVLIHTDASVVAQGAVAECLQLSGLAGFTTAGTIHLIVNNQIGFTTDAHEARTSRHCTGLWKAVDSLILHVNGDEPDAALRAADLAFDFRQSHGRDAVIDLVCYRRNGHNEIDEPRFTHPMRYRAIDEHPSVGDQFTAQLVAEGVASAAEIEAVRAASLAKLRNGFAAAEAYRPNGDGLPRDAEAALDISATQDTTPATGVAMERLGAMLSALSSTPEGLSLDPKVDRLVRQRADSAKTSAPWALAEALAFATLLSEGTAIRLSGQDAVRGAFSHRHFALTDTKTGRRHISLNHLGAPQAKFEAINSPLSEYAVLGFEYGYSLERPDALVIWEAQFGDFANGAQIVIDQFIASGEEKWRQASGIVILLPHGLEGQGPEHSSARIERFLQLAARNNLLITQPSTPANYFHLLRRQARCNIRKPLIVFTPKSLLRLPAAVSPLEDLGLRAAFRPIIVSRADERVQAVIMCSGKIAYDLAREQKRRNAEAVAILRIEQLYPLPVDDLLGVFRQFREAKFIWAQDEPENMGAWNFLDRRLEALLIKAGVRRPQISSICRPQSPSPAGGFHCYHERDQQSLIEAAFQRANAGGN
jgi:2-oxoglutarate dehydrogenase E1 component